MYGHSAPEVLTVNTLLIINSSPRSNSVSRRLTRHFAEEWKAKHPDTRVVERDLTANPLPFVTEPWIQASYTPPAQRTPQQLQALALSDALIDELMMADVIVLGVPMHNFSIPAPLKAWFDLVARVGKTFSYSDKGPKGLIASDKRVVAIVSRGGAFDEGSASASSDFQVPYLRHMLRFLGLEGVIVIAADKQGFGAEVAQQSVDRAIRKLSALAEHFPSPTAMAA
jgi:FMN-dependent NADH-azoreductase